jgi:alpha-tubulin suppressor-like RCC1 family protein
MWHHSGFKTGKGTPCSHLRKVPTQVGTDRNSAQVEASIVWHAYSCAVRTDGTAWCWGYNQNGELGQGDRKKRKVPAQVGEDTDWSAVTVGAGHTCATRTDATLWCWGANEAGQLGEGGVGDRSVPTEVPSERMAGPWPMQVRSTPVQRRPTARCGVGC